jgi:cyclophilin family peptidyl-prolyl cis-trans isomerase
MPGPRLPLLALVLAAAAGSAACGGSGADERSATPAGAGSGTTASGCRRVSQPAPKAVRLPKPHITLSPRRTWVATVSTSCGAFRITLDVKRAPRTAASFAYLARKHVFDRTTFHRILANFVIQGGDPKGDGTGGPGYTVVEAPPKRLRYTRGVVAMAKGQLDAPGTSGSQFFVVVVPDAQLPPEYALLGRVSGGQAAVNRITAVDANPQTGQPAEPVVIDNVTVAAR